MEALNAKLKEAQEKVKHEVKNMVSAAMKGALGSLGNMGGDLVGNIGGGLF